MRGVRGSKITSTKATLQTILWQQYGAYHGKRMNNMGQWCQEYFSLTPPSIAIYTLLYCPSAECSVLWCCIPHCVISVFPIVLPSTYHFGAQYSSLGCPNAIQR